jgi:copper homeostasis protein CutC
MSKANKDMSEQEFNYTYACKRMMNDLYILEHDLKQAKTVGMQGISKGALTNVEARLYDLQAAILNALKTV